MKNIGKSPRNYRNTSRAPIVSSIDDSLDKGANVLVIGISPSGGESQQNGYIIEYAISKVMSIVNGLHDLLYPRYNERLNENQWIWDVRVPQTLQQLLLHKP